MLSEKFQEYNRVDRFKIYEKIKDLLNNLKNSEYPNIYKKIREDNPTKARIIEMIINAKVDLGYDWENCLNVIEENI